MRRVGNRFALALKRWLRQSRQIELLRFRQRWARKFDEYECQGGPLDGEVRKCESHSVYPIENGYYEIDRGDCRLHYRTGSKISSWSSGL